MAKNLTNEELQNIIVGRVDPHIYAFSTNTVPNYLKVGDTYRPVATRLKEWEQHFPKLKKEFEDKAKLNDETFFRDYEVHKFLETNDKERHNPDEVVHNSREFFKDTKSKDISNAIVDIKDDFKSNSGKYKFYKFDGSRVAQHIEVNDLPKRITAYINKSVLPFALALLKLAIATC